MRNIFDRIPLWITLEDGTRYSFKVRWSADWKDSFNRRVWTIGYFDGDNDMCTGIGDTYTKALKQFTENVMKYYGHILINTKKK